MTTTAFFGGSLEDGTLRDEIGMTEMEVRQFRAALPSTSASSAEDEGGGKVEAEGDSNERRYDEGEGPFTKAEFFDIYGGYGEWDAAAAYSA